METDVNVIGKLIVSDEDFQKLKRAIITFREACNYISEIAYNEGCFNSVALHHLTYKKVRMKYNLPANLAVRARDKVVTAYKKNRKKLLLFKGLNMDLDRRVINILSDDDNIIISIRTLKKRVRSKFLIEPAHEKLLNTPIVRAKLTLRANELFLNILFRPEKSIIETI
jgi:predicted transposase